MSCAALVGAATSVSSFRRCSFGLQNRSRAVQFERLSAEEEIPDVMASEADIYRKLQQHLDRMPIGFPPTSSGVEIRILQQLFSREEAEIALQLSALPEPAQVIYKRLKSKMTLLEMRQRLEQMGKKGLILTLPGPEEVRYGKLIFAIGMYERQVKRLTPEFERDSQQYLQEAFGEAFHSKKTTQMRIVPINHALKIKRDVASYDDIRAYVESCGGPFAKMTCICRHGKELLGEKCKQTTLRDNCLTVGNGARAMVDHGIAEFISLEEMLELLNAADQEGLVLQPENTKNPLFVCCCCGCCCNVLISAKQFPRPAEYFSSNLCAEVDQDSCNGCEACAARCQMSAILLVDGNAQVDSSRCIGCSLCVPTCPAEAIRLRQKNTGRVPPDTTQDLYVQILQERYGPAGMAKLAARKILGMKI